MHVICVQGPEQQPSETLDPRLPKLGVALLEHQIRSGGVGELSQKRAPEVCLARLSATRQHVEMAPIDLLFVVKVAPEIAKVDNNMVRQVVVEPDSPKRAAAKVTVFNRVLGRFVVVLGEDVTREPDWCQVVRRVLVGPKIVCQGIRIRLVQERRAILSNSDQELDIASAAARLERPDSALSHGWRQDHLLPNQSGEGCPAIDAAKMKRIATI